MSPYRFPGKPCITFSSAWGENEVKVWENFGDYYGSREMVWPIEDYRKAHRLAPQDLVVNVTAPVMRWVRYRLSDGRVLDRYEPL